MLDNLFSITGLGVSESSVKKEIEFQKCNKFNLKEINSLLDYPKYTTISQSPLFCMKKKEIILKTDLLKDTSNSTFTINIKKCEYSPSCQLDQQRFSFLLEKLNFNLIVKNFDANHNSFEDPLVPVYDVFTIKLSSFYTYQGGNINSQEINISLKEIKYRTENSLLFDTYQEISLFNHEIISQEQIGSVTQSDIVLKFVIRLGNKRDTYVRKYAKVSEAMNTLNTIALSIMLIGRFLISLFEEHIFFRKFLNKIYIQKGNYVSTNANQIHEFKNPIKSEILPIGNNNIQPSNNINDNLISFENINKQDDQRYFMIFYSITA